MAGAVSVDYTTYPITATESDDFVATSGTLNWAAGEGGVQTISVQINDDAVVENTEFFGVRISSVAGSVIGSDRVLVQLYDEDSAPNPGRVVFRHSRLSIPEDVGTVTYELARVGGSLGAVSVDYMVNNAVGILSLIHI